MSTLVKTTFVLFAATLLGACAQQEEPAPQPEVVVIEEDTTYSKF